MSVAKIKNNGSWQYMNTLTNPHMYTGAKTVAASDWVSDSTYTGYPYRASIAITGVTASDFATVVFSPSEHNAAPVCDTYSGGVYVYSKTAKSTSILNILIAVGAGSAS